MTKSIVIKAETRGLRAMLAFGAVLAALFALIDSQLAMHSAMVSCVIIPSLFLGKHLVFGQKFLSIRSCLSEDYLVNYNNIKAISEKNESSRYVDGKIIVIQLQDNKEIPLDITEYKEQDKIRIQELLFQKLTEVEQSRK